MSELSLKYQSKIIETENTLCLPTAQEEGRKRVVNSCYGSYLDVPTASRTHRWGFGEVIRSWCVADTQQWISPLVSEFTVKCDPGRWITAALVLEGSVSLPSTESLSTSSCNEFFLFCHPPLPWCHALDWHLYNCQNKLLFL